MENFLKKLTVTVCAVAASAVLIAAPLSVMASSATTRPLPGTTASESTASEGTTADERDTSSATGTTTGTVAASSSTTSNAVTAAGTTAQNTQTNKKYLSRLGGFLWFLLSVIVNFVLSSWIANRFYNMSKRNAQSSSEIRALRKDIEEKFASTVTDISEPATEVINRNENYARSDEGLGMPERRVHIELSDQEQEMMRRWDENRQPAQREDEEDYFEEPEFEVVRKPARRAYQPQRETPEYEEKITKQERRPARMQRGKEKDAASTLSNAKNKAKDFLSNVFPFDE